MWHLDVDKTHLAILPPVGLIGHGPAGIAYYPGTGLPDQYRDHFFYADFPGGVRSFKIVPRGASYSVENPGDILQNNSQKEMTGKLLWGLFPSDVQFGVEGGAYVLDWIQGWEKTGKGRIYRVHDPVTDASPLVRETKKLLGEGMDKRPAAELVKLLSHADQRVRLGAQFALVAKGDVEPLAHAAADRAEPLFGRLHAIWGLGQLAVKSAPAQQALAALLPERDAEVRAQAAKCLGNDGIASAAPALLKLLVDPAPRVRFFAAQSLGKLHAKDAVPQLFQLLQDNANGDAFIRHACVVALASTTDAETLVRRTGDISPAVRAGALLALRRLASPEIVRFLHDHEPLLVAEAARAIHDGPIPAGYNDLAVLGGERGRDESLTRRIANANYLVGNRLAAERLARNAADPHAATPLRLEAITSLGMWNEPFGRDRITGLWHTVPAGRVPDAASDAVARIIPALLHDADLGIQLAGADLAGRLKVPTAEAPLVAAVMDGLAEGSLRAAALRALDGLASPKLADAVQQALGSGDKTLAEAGRKLAGKASPRLAVQVNAAVLGSGSIREQQEAIATIAAQPVPEADAALLGQFDQLAAGKLKRGLWLDLFDAAALRNTPKLTERVTEYEATLGKDPLARFAECLEGGDAKVGRAIFTEKAEAACLRCHKITGEGGDVGPDLGGLGKKKDRAYLLQSIVDPNAVIAPGYENVMLTLKDGSIVAGLLNAETATDLTLASLTDGKKQKVPKATVKERLAVPSAMPPGLAEILGKRGLRDVVEFLATVK